MSVAQFARRLDLYTDEEIEQTTFTDSIRTVSVRKNFGGINGDVLKEWWLTIGSGEFVSPASSRLIRDPFIRFLHRAITGTITARYESNEKVTQDDLLVLYCLIGPGEGNVASILLHFLDRARTGASRICQGHYVTMLARAFGLLDEYDLQSLVPGPQATTISETDMVQMQLLTETVPRRFADPEPLAIADAGDQGTSQAPSRRPQPRRAPRASDPPVTLASVRDEVREVREEVRSLTDWVVQALRDIAAERGVQLQPYPPVPPPGDA